MFRNNKFFVFSALVLTFFNVGCVKQIDFEHDVPQRAKSISSKQADLVRSSMEVPELRKKYREHMRQQKASSGDSGKTLAQLRQEKRNLEQRIARIIRSNNSQVCPICKKKYNIKTSKKSHVVRKKKPVKKTIKKTAPQQQNQAEMNNMQMMNNQYQQQMPMQMYPQMPEQQMPMYPQMPDQQMPQMQQMPGYAQQMPMQQPVQQIPMFPMQ